MVFKRWIRFFWAGSVVSCVLVAISVLVIFKNTSNADERYVVEIPEHNVVNKVTPPHLGSYSDIWNARINTTPPRITKKTQQPPQNWLAQLLQQHIIILNIFSDDFAIVSVNNQHRLVEVKTNANKKQRNKSWQINLSNNLVDIVKIVPEKGIKFECKGQQQWLMYTKPKLRKPQNPNQRNPMAQNQRQHRVSPKDRQRIIKNYERFIRELGPVQHYEYRGSRRVPVGLRIRRVLPNSNAYKYGLRVNDVVTRINGLPIRSLSQLSRINKLSRRNRHRGNLVFEVKRNSKKIRLDFKIQ